MLLRLLLLLSLAFGPITRPDAGLPMQECVAAAETCCPCCEIDDPSPCGCCTSVPEQTPPQPAAPQPGPSSSPAAKALLPTSAIAPQSIIEQAATITRRDARPTHPRVLRSHLCVWHT